MNNVTGMNDRYRNERTYQFRYIKHGNSWTRASDISLLSQERKGTLFIRWLINSQTLKSDHQPGGWTELLIWGRFSLDQIDSFADHYFRLKSMFYFLYIRDVIRWIRSCLKAFRLVFDIGKALICSDDRGLDVGGYLYSKNTLLCFRSTSRSPLSSGDHSMAPTLVLSSTMRTVLRLAGLSGTSAICLGVYGAHGMKDDVPDDRKRVCSTHVRQLASLCQRCIVGRYSSWLKTIIYFIQ